MAKQTALEIVREFTDRRGLPRPSNLLNSSEKSARQYLSLLNVLVRDLRRFSWSQQKLRATWTAVENEFQGELSALFGNDFIDFVPGTFWSIDKRLPLRGPVSDQEWEALKVLTTAGPEYTVYVAGGGLYLNPIPKAGEQFSVVYKTKAVVLSNGVAADVVTGNEDTFLVPDDVIHAGLQWVWNKEKGEAWADDYGYYMALIADRRELANQTPLQLDGAGTATRPNIAVPPGNWVL